MDFCGFYCLWHSFRLWYMKVKVLITQSCPTFCDPMDCSPPDSSVHGIFQARILECIPFSRGSSRLRDGTWVSHIAGRFFTIWATREVTYIFSNPIMCYGGAWKAAVHGVAEGRTWLSGFTFTFHFHALEKEMATHSSVLAWRIPGTGEPGGLPSMGSHRVGPDWSNLAAAAALHLG